MWECLPVPRDICEKAKKSPTIEDLNEFFPGLVALTDASGQPIQRPKRSDMGSHYAKTHTVKMQHTISFDGLIVHKTAHSPGRRHDFKIYKMHPTFPGGLRCGNEANQGKFRRNHLRHHTDTAYVAMGKAVPGLNYVTPFKRMPGKDLTPEQRAYNRAHCMVRIPYQNGIRRVEAFRIMKRYRNNLE